MQIRSVQAVTLQHRYKQKPQTFSSLPSRQKSQGVYNHDLLQYGVSEQALRNQSAAIEAVSNSAEIQLQPAIIANATNRKLSNQSLLERQVSNQANLTMPLSVYHATDQKAAVIGGKSTHSAESLSKQLNVVSPPTLKKRLMTKRVSTEQGFILGVQSDGSVTPDDAASPHHTVSFIDPRDAVNHITVQQKPIGARSFDPILENDDGNVQTQSQQKMMDGQHNNQQKLVASDAKVIQVHATSKKATEIRTFLTTERFELSGSAHMDSAMKPVRLASGMSEDATPMSQSKFNMLPKGLQLMQMQTSGHGSGVLDSTTNQNAPSQFRVLASHYPETQNYNEHVGNLDGGDIVRIENGDFVGVIGVQMTPDETNQQLEQQSLMGNGIVQGHLSIERLEEHSSGDIILKTVDSFRQSSSKAPMMSPESFRVVASTTNAAHQNLKINTQINSSTGQQQQHLNQLLSQTHTGTGSNLSQKKSRQKLNQDTSKDSLAQDLNESLQISAIFPHNNNLNTKNSNGQQQLNQSTANNLNGSNNETGEQQSTSWQPQQVSDYSKQAFKTFKTKRTSQRAKPDAKHRRPKSTNKKSGDIIMTSRQQEIVGESMRTDQVLKVKKMKTAFENQARRIASHDSLQSSNSHRLNQDIMSAKIENCNLIEGGNAPEVRKLTTNHGNSSESLDDKGNDYVVPSTNFMAHKLASFDAKQSQKATSLSHKWVKENGSNKVTVFATVDVDSQNQQAQHESPVFTRGPSPKRKSVVLSRNSKSKASPKQQKSKSPRRRQDLNQQNMNTLNGTMSSQEQEILVQQSQQTQHLNDLNSKSVSKKHRSNNDETQNLYSGQSMAANSINKPELIGSEIITVKKQRESGMTLNRESSEDIRANSSEILLSRVGNTSTTQQHHAETMRHYESNQSGAEHYKNIIGVAAYKPEIYEDDRHELRYKAHSVEDTEALPVGKSEDHRQQRMPTQGDNHASSDSPDQLLQIHERKSSAAFQATSLGEESFIHPPSPIQGEIMMGRFTNHNNSSSRKQQAATLGNWKQTQSSKSGGNAPHIVCGTTTSSNFTFTHGPQAKGKTGNEQMIISGSGNPVALEKSTQLNNNNNEEVDVMHAGIDTQDFVELSGSENNHMPDDEDDQNNAQHALDQIEKHHAEKINLDLTKKKKLDMRKRSTNPTESQDYLSQTAKSLKDLKAGRAMPTVSCLCRELELTPDQFSQIAQKYKRQPRVILKSETEQNRVLLVNADGTSKDSHMIDQIIHGTIKVSGLGIAQVVSEHKQYFQQLLKKELAFQGRRNKLAAQARSGSPEFLHSASDFILDGSTGRTMEKTHIQQQLAQFVQYGLEFGVKNSSTASLLKSRHQSNVMHSKCDGVYNETEGLNTPLLMNSQYIGDQSKMDSSHNYNQLFQTQHLQSTQRGDHPASLSPTTNSLGHTKIQVVTTDPYSNRQLHNVNQRSVDREMSSRNYHFANDTADNTLKPKHTGQSDQGLGVGAADLNEASNMTSWAKIPGLAVSSEIKDTEAAEDVNKNFISLQADDAANENTLLKLNNPLVRALPTKVEITRPSANNGRSKVQYLNNNDNPNYQSGNGMRTQLQVNSKDITPPSHMVEGPDYLVNMNQTYYLDNQFTKSSENKEIKEQIQADIIRRQKTTNPALDYQHHRQGGVGSKQNRYLSNNQVNEPAFNESQSQMARESLYTTTNEIQTKKGRKTKKQRDRYLLKKQSRSLSKDCDISTQRRHSNDASRFVYDDGEEDDRQTQHLNSTQQQISKQTGKVSSVRDANVYNNRSQTASTRPMAKKRTQIGTWSAAVCKLTPGQIELKVSQNSKLKADKKRRDQDLVSREIQVIQSKKGMIANISRVFNSALSHNTEQLVKNQMKQQNTYGSSQTRMHANRLHSSDDKSLGPTRIQEPQIFYLSNGPTTNNVSGIQLKDRASLDTAKMPNVVGEDNSRQPSLQQNNNNQNVVQKLYGQLMMGSEPVIDNKEDSNKFDSKTGGTYAILNTDLPTNMNSSKTGGQGSSQYTPGQVPWANFNPTRRLTTNQLPKRDKSILHGYGRITNNTDAEESTSLLKQDGDTNSQILTPTAKLFSNMQNQLSNQRLIPSYNSKHKQNLAESDVMTQHGMEQLSFLDKSVMNQTLYKRQPGQPLVRITKSQNQQFRGAKIAQKSASLLLKGKNPMMSKGMKSFKQSRRNDLSPSYMNNNNAGACSVEQIIKDLGNEDSELNKKLLNQVETRANFRSALDDTNANEYAASATNITDYPWKSGAQNVASNFVQPRNKKKHATTASNFFSAANLKNQSGAQLLQSHLDMSQTTMTAAHSSMHKLGMKTGDHWTNKTTNSNLNIKQLHASSAMQKTALAFNRAKGSLLPQQLNQVNSDLLPMDPVQQMLNLQRQGQKNQTTKTEATSLMNTRTRVQSQNIQKRQQIENAATEIYYNLRKSQKEVPLDLAEIQGSQFRYDDNSHIVLGLHRRLSSDGQATPLGVYMEQTNEFSKKPKVEYTGYKRPCTVNNN